MVTKSTCPKAATSESWMPVATALAGMSCVASADALSGIAEAVRRVTIKNARVLFMTLENLRFGYNRLFFFNTSIWSSGKMKTSVQGHEEIEVNNILLIK